MSKGDFTVPIKGLEELREELSSSKITKEIALGVGTFVRKLHSELSFEVSKRYNVRNRSGGKVLDRILDQKSTSTQVFGQKVIKSSLVYNYVPIPLARFQESISDPGKIGNWFYATHNVTVRRGSETPSSGFYGKGGFVPRHGYGKHGSPGAKVFTKNFAKTGYQMLERESNTRYPLRLMFGPSLSEMTEHIYDMRLGKVGNVLDETESFILSTLENLWKQ